MTSPSLDAIVLAGGRATRFGADKAAATIDDETLLQRVVDAARRAGAVRVVVVGPRRPLRAGADVLWCREDPPFGGPAAGIGAAIGAVTANDVLVLACDLRRPTDALAALGAVPPGTDAVVPVDDAGRKQWLTARYRTAALRKAVHDSGGLEGAAVRELMHTLECAHPVMAEDHLADVDTRADLNEAGGRASVARISEDDMADSPTHLSPEDLDAWVVTMRERFDLSVEAVPTGDILDLARDAAHAVARPAAPLAAFVAGFVAARDGGGPAKISEVIDEVSKLADGWKGAK